MAALHVAVYLLLSLQQVLCELTPVEWSTQVSSSSKCGEAYTSDLTNALTTLAKLISDSTVSLPTSCLEVKNGFSVSPSGYYTIVNATSGSTSIVYCDMDNLNTCPALEQTLTGFMNDYQVLSTYVSDIQTGVDNLQFGFNSFATNDDVTSCEDIKNKWPWAASGWYKISSEDVYCHMGDLCNEDGPWRRVLYLDMTDLSQTCPSEFRIYNSNGVRVCGRPAGGGSCVDTTSPPSSLSYSEICWRVIGYQWGSPDGLQSGTIDGIYVDGISITRGSPRQHVWTLINTYNDNSNVQCPCAGGSSTPSFVGDDYYCESGLQGGWSQVLYTADPIWDGQGCGSGETACCLDGMPWFYKNVGSTTTDYIEIRTCGNQHTNDEDSTISLYEIFVK